MSNVRQWQRMAIEDVRPPWLKTRRAFPELISGQTAVFVTPDGQPLVFLGVSTGVGPCSQILGINVAVFGLGGKRVKPVRLDEQLVTAKYSVLLHRGTMPDKYGNPRRIVQLLTWESPSFRKCNRVFVRFRPADRMTRYVVTV